MGMWDFICSTIDAVKRISPDLTPVKNYTWSAVTNIHNAVRTNVNYGLNQNKPDDETVAKIGRLAKFFAENAADYALNEGLNSVPGGKAVTTIVSKTSHDERAFQDEIVRPEKDPFGWKKSPERAEIHKLGTKLTSQNAFCLGANASQKPEDVINIFMMKEFVGRNVMGDLLTRS